MQTTTNMPSIIIDFDQSLHLVDPGEYEASVDSIELLQDQQTKKGPMAAALIGYKLKESNVVIYCRYYQPSTNRALFTVAGRLLGQIPSRVNLQALVGRACRVTVEHQHDNQGRVWARIVDVHQLAPVTHSEADDLFDYED